MAKDEAVVAFIVGVYFWYADDVVSGYYWPVYGFGWCRLVLLWLLGSL
jgi:hypothetical protein